MYIDIYGRITCNSENWKHSRGMVKKIMIYLWKTMQPQKMMIRKTIQGKCLLSDAKKVEHKNYMNIKIM